MDNLIVETQLKGIRMEKDLIQKIETLAKEGQRDFSKQVKYMLIEYIKLKESK